MKQVCMFLILCILITSFSALIYAENETGEDFSDNNVYQRNEDAEEFPEIVMETVEFLPDNEELFAGYVSQVFEITEDDEQLFDYDSDIVIETIEPSYKAALDTQNQKALDLFKAMASEVANGKRESTAFRVSLYDLGFTKLTFSAEELGVELFDEEGNISQEAIDAMRSLLTVDVQVLIPYLLAESPYEFYWFDKTAGYRLSLFLFGIGFINIMGKGD